MRTCAIVIGNVLFENAVQVAFAEKEMVIQAFLTDGTNPAFSEGIGVRRLRRGEHNLDTFGAENSIESRGEFGIAVMDEEAHGVRHGWQLPSDLPGLLSDPG